ncbi:MAG: hypothetical protein QMD32_07250, partial [Smithellaceae bacterium]|nr:hypothetical protein [Smithellaceae bacterium]
WGFFTDSSEARVRGFYLTGDLHFGPAFGAGSHTSFHFLPAGWAEMPGNIAGLTERQIRLLHFRPA